MMKKTFCLLTIAVLLCACSGKGGKSQGTEASASQDSVVTIDVKYATGFSVRDSADVRFVSVGKGNCFALVHSDEVQVPEGCVKVRVPIRSTICMTALQLSNFTVLDAHDVVRGITGTKNLFNKDILGRVKDGRMVKIGMEGEFDTNSFLLPTLTSFSSRPRSVAGMMLSRRRASRWCLIWAIRNSTRWDRRSGSSSWVCSLARSARPTRCLRVSNSAIMN